MLKVLGSIPSTTEKKRKNETERGVKILPCPEECLFYSSVSGAGQIQAASGGGGGGRGKHGVVPGTFSEGTTAQQVVRKRGTHYSGKPCMLGSINREMESSRRSLWQKQGIVQGGPLSSRLASCGIPVPSYSTLLCAADRRRRRPQV